ncbi:eukaryotic translation initiation factor 4 gamma 1-like [Branchiostoma floridae]|uniref:Eukaryotic translation initiation factor 4 gamma 1-like n=1 Tax=Branchiostoma floridae TaxID=7739 RepID=A0A9J7M9G1_BRAFL|nr:eukaryotic translation initiation factor 4 gamma 1-like [Branchiostoma floridae]
MSLKQGKNSTVSPGPQQIQVQAQSGGPNSRTLRGGPPPRPEDYHQPRAIPAYTHPGSAAQQQGLPIQQGRHPHTAPSPHDMNKGQVSSQGPPPVVGTPPTGPSPGPQMSQQTQMYASVSMSQGHRSSQPGMGRHMQHHKGGPRQHQGPRQGHQPYYRSSGPTANGRVPYQTGPRYSAPQTVTSAPPPQMFQHPNQMIPGHVPQQAYPQPTLFIPQQYPPVLQYRPQAIPHFQPPQPTIQSATAYFQPAPQGPGPGGTQATYRTGGEQLQYFQSYGYAPQAQPMQTTQQQRPPSMPTGQITMIPSQQPPQPPQQVTPPLQQQTQQQQQQLPQKRERKIIKITDNTGRDVTEEILSGGSGSSNPTPPNSGRSSATATPPQTQQQAAPPTKPGENTNTNTSIAAQFAAQVAATLDTSPTPNKDTSATSAGSSSISAPKEATGKSESPKPGQVAAPAAAAVLTTPTIQPETPAVVPRTEEQSVPSEQAAVPVAVDTPAYVPVAEPSPAKAEQPAAATTIASDDTDSVVSKRAEPVAAETKPVAMGTKPVAAAADSKPVVAAPPTVSKDSNPPPPVPKSAQSMVVDSKDKDATKDRNAVVATESEQKPVENKTSAAKPKLPEEVAKAPPADVTKAPETKSEEKPAAEVAAKKPAGETVAPEKAAAPTAVEEVNDESPQAKQVAKKSQKKKMKELNKKGDSKDTDLMDAFREKDESQTVEEPKPQEEPKTETPPPPPQAKPEETKVEVKVDPPKEEKPEVKEAPKAQVVPPKVEPPAPKVETSAAPKEDSPAPKVDGVTNNNETEENDEDVVEIEDKSGLKYKYREDQWSPLNPEGKKQYDRSFLLQFQPECIDKPDGLPKIVDVVLDKPLIITPQQMQGRPQDFRGMGGFNKGGPPGIPDLMPSYMKSPGGGHGRMVHGPNMGRQQSRGGNRREPRKIIPSLTNRLDDVELNKSENAWKPSSTIKKGSEKSPEEKETDEIFKKVQGILNKLTPQKFQTLCQQVLDLDIVTEERLKGVIDLVFEKAITEPNFSVAYANMCRCLIHLKVPMKDNPKQTVNFRKLLLNRCQREFEKDKDDELKKDERMKKIELAKNEDEKKMMEVELEQEMTKARRRSLGNIRFIGELFKLKMLTENIMHDCVVKLLKSNDEESLECLCRLLTTIGKDLDFEKAKPRMDQYFQQMDKIIKQKKTSSRVRFMIQDVLELRMNNWVPRRDDNNPKTIDQIHKEAELESQQQNLKLAQLKQDRRGQDRRGGGGGGGGRNVPQAASTQDGDGWNTVPVGKSARVSIDPNRLKFSKQQFDDGNIQLGPGGRPGAFGGWMKGSSGGTGAKSAQQQQQQQQEDSGRSTPSNRYSALSGDMSYDASRRNTSRGGSGSRDNSKTGRGQQQAPAIGRRNSRDQARDDQRFARDSVVDSLKRIESVGSRRSQSGERPERPERVREEPEKERRQGEKSRPSPTPSPAPPPAATPQLDRAGMEKKSQAILDEYLGIRDLKVGHEILTLACSSLLCQSFYYFKRGHQMCEETSLIKVDYTLDESRALPRKPEPLTMDRIQDELERLLMKDRADNEKIFDWIEASVDEATTKERTFIRALMTAVCRSAITGEGSNLRCDTQGIQKRVVLLQKYLDNESTRELQALFALQALMVQLDQPPNLLRMFFDTLYDEDVISEDAFYAWESNTDPAEQEGKGVALKSVTAFFTWLREAEEEETDS